MEDYKAWIDRKAAHGATVVCASCAETIVAQSPVDRVFAVCRDCMRVDFGVAAS